MLVTNKMVARAMTFVANEALWPLDEMYVRKLLVVATSEPSRSGRPSVVTPDMIARVLERVAKGDSLRRICREDETLCEPLAIMNWITVSGMGRQYAQARDTGIDARFDDLVELAETANADNAQAVRLRVDVEKWALSKLKPGKYGDRLDLNVSGSVELKTMTDDSLNARVEQRLRDKLEPVFAMIEHPTLDDVLRPFRITPIPVLTYEPTGESDG